MLVAAMPPGFKVGPVGPDDLNKNKHELRNYFRRTYSMQIPIKQVHDRSIKQ